MLRWLTIFFVLTLSSSLSFAEDRFNASSVYIGKDISELKMYEGKPIGTVQVVVVDVFEGDKLNSFYRTANSIKINTRERIVRQELLFKEGDTFSTFLVKESERNLRSQKFLRNITITPVDRGSFVDVVVSVQDTWTLIPSLSYSSGDGDKSTSVGLVESNIAGFGKRTEFILSEEDNRKSFEGIYEDPRVWGSSLKFLGAQFYRNDGNRTVLRLANPFRTLLDRTAWSVDTDNSDTVGKLWENGDERYIFRQQTSEVGASHTWMVGNPEKDLRRYSLGYKFEENNFEEASPEDYDDVDVDPTKVLNNPELLAENRRYTGPSLGYEALEPSFIKMNYIDRFDREDDFDLGDNFSFYTTVAPEAVGSVENAALLNTNRSAGSKLGETSFIRGEFGAYTRLTDEFSNTLLRAESKYYDVLGPLYVKDMFLGKHTFAFGYSLDWGVDLDRDREFLLGADTGLRGYESRTFAGDKRFIANIEDRIHIAEDVWKLVSFGAAAFADVGGTSDGALGDIFNNNLYADVGVGLRVAFPRSTGGRMLRLDLAFPVRDGPDGSTGYELRVIFAGGPIFNSKLRSETLGSQDANVEIGFDK